MGTGSKREKAMGKSTLAISLLCLGSFLTSIHKVHGYGYGSLQAAPHGYSCNVNGWDAVQYCVCKKGERINKFASKHWNHKEDRQWRRKMDQHNAGEQMARTPRMEWSCLKFVP